MQEAPPAFSDLPGSELLCGKGNVRETGPSRGATTRFGILKCAARRHGLVSTQTPRRKTPARASAPPGAEMPRRSAFSEDTAADKPRTLAPRHRVLQTRSPGPS